MGLSVNIIFMNVLPLHETVKLGDHWFQIYYKYYTDRLGFIISIFNHYLFHHYNNMIKYIGIQTDDIFILVNNEFV